MTDVLEAAPKPRGEQRGRKREVVYPISDGKPMAESDLHYDLMVYFKEALRDYHREQPLVYVSGNNFLYWEQGNPRAVISPDTYVVFGVPMMPRDYYMTWKEGGKLPSVVFEFTSKKTRREDVEKKRPIYEQILKVPEYFQFDPTGDYLRPRFQGFRLVEGRYVPLNVVANRLHSQALGLDMVQEGDWLRLYDPKADRYLLSPQENAQRVVAEAQRAEDALRQAAEELARRNEAEERIRQLEAQLAALRVRSNE